MIGALNMFDVSPINAGMQAGMQRGAVNSPFTPLGQALKGTLDMYNKNRAAQQEQAYKMEQIGAQGQNALDVANAGIGRKTSLAEAALKEQEKLRGQSYIDEATGITYDQGARFMDDPAGGRRLVSNAIADEGTGTANWGPWSYAPQQDIMRAKTDEMLTNAGMGVAPKRTLPVRRVGTSPIPGVDEPPVVPPVVPQRGQGGVRPIGAGTKKDQTLMELLKQL